MYLNRGMDSKMRSMPLLPRTSSVPSKIEKMQQQLNTNVDEQSAGWLHCEEAINSLSNASRKVDLNGTTTLLCSNMNESSMKDVVNGTQKALEESNRNMRGSGTSRARCST